MSDNVNPVFKPILDAMTTTIPNVFTADAIITRQNWHCTAGYCRTASVRQNKFKGQENPQRQSRYTHWGAHLFDPPRRLEITDPKNSNYGNPPNPDPYDECVKYCTENNLSYLVEWHESSE